MTYNLLLSFNKFPNHRFQRCRCHVLWCHHYGLGCAVYWHGHVRNCHIAGSICFLKMFMVYYSIIAV